MRGANRGGGGWTLPRLPVAVWALFIWLWPVALQAAGPAISPSAAKELWGSYKASILQQDGRVIDRQQQGISHSEGQGYGLLLAALYDDRPAFEAILRWTRDNLSGRKDHLHPWAWGQRCNGEWAIIDYNNATDGDLLLAFALVKGGERWQVPEYRREGVLLIGAIRSRLAIAWRERSYLLPSYYGFQKEGELVLNPSYQIFVAYRLFSTLDDRVFWEKVYRDSLHLAAAASQGKLQLPADWVVLTEKGISPWKERAPLFGYDAVRVLLYLCWEDEPSFPAGLKRLLAFYREHGYLPATFDLAKATPLPGEAYAGFYAVCARAAERSGDAALGAALWGRALQKAAAEKGEYYSLSLLLLAAADPAR